MKTKIIMLVISLTVLTTSTAYAINDTEQNEHSEILLAEEQETAAVCVPLTTFIEDEKTILKKEKTNRINLGEFTLTAYCSCQKCCGKWALNRPKDEHGNEIVYGSNGDVLKQGVSVAVDPKVIPMGTKIYINNHEYIAQDTGGAIKGKKIDVYFDNHQEAVNFGKKTDVVEVDETTNLVLQAND